VGGDLKRERDRLTVVAEAIRTCARAGAVDHVVLIDFNGHPQFGDDAIHAELAHRLENCVSTERVRYCDDPVAVMRRIATLRGMLAMRLHAAIFAFCTSVPAVLLSYHEKCREWARMVGAPMDQTMDTGQMDPTVLVSQIKALSKSEPPLSAMKPVEAVGRAIENWSWCS
jgi:polysaccharide pyruvyl transferase WcaK-like protein